MFNERVSMSNNTKMLRFGNLIYFKKAKITRILFLQIHSNPEGTAVMMYVGQWFTLKCIPIHIKFVLNW